MQSKRRKTVICIDDDSGMIALIASILRHAELDLIGAVDGEKGLEAIRNVKPDLVLLDLMMPDIDGWEVYRQMKADDHMKNIPVILVTAKAQSIEKVIRLRLAEVVDYVTKPFAAQELLRSVNRALASTA